MGCPPEHGCDDAGTELCLSSASHEPDALSNVFSNFGRRHRSSLGFIKKKDGEAQSEVKQLVQSSEVAHTLGLEPRQPGFRAPPGA